MGEGIKNQDEDNEVENGRVKIKETKNDFNEIKFSFFLISW